MRINHIFTGLLRLGNWELGAHAKNVAHQFRKGHTKSEGVYLIRGDEERGWMDGRKAACVGWLGPWQGRRRSPFTILSLCT